MILYETGIEMYDDGSTRKYFQMEPPENCNELKGYLLSFQDTFGDVWDIIVKRYVGDNKVLFYGRYETLYDFLENFNISDVRKYNIYEFLCNNLHCKIDTEKNTMDIYKSNHIAEPESDNYEYYKFNGGLIVRYNVDNGKCYYLNDDNKWICKYSLQSMVDDAAYSYDYHL